MAISSTLLFCGVIWRLSIAKLTSALGRLSGVPSHPILDGFPYLQLRSQKWASGSNYIHTIRDFKVNTVFFDFSNAPRLPQFFLKWKYSWEWDVSHIIPTSHHWINVVLHSRCFRFHFWGTDHKCYLILNTSMIYSHCIRAYTSQNSSSSPFWLSSRLLSWNPSDYLPCLWQGLITQI